MQQRHWIYVLSLALSVCVWTGCDNGETTNPVDTSSADMTMDVSGDGTTGDAGDTGGGDGTTTCDPECGANQSCVDGACACDEGFEDCDLEASNGCEVELGTESDCLSCGDTCAVAQNVTGLVCTSTGCDWTDCVAGFDDCDGNKRNGCEVELATDVDHCGACDAACNFANSTGECTDSACVITECEDGGFDIDEDPNNGCELKVTENINEHKTREFNAFGFDNGDLGQLALRPGVFEFGIDSDDGCVTDCENSGRGKYLAIQNATDRSNVDVDRLALQDLHIAPDLEGSSEPLLFANTVNSVLAIDLDQSTRPMEVTASLNTSFAGTSPSDMKSMELPIGVRNGQMISTITGFTTSEGFGVVTWFQVAKVGDPEFGDSSCSATSGSGFQLCFVDLVSSSSQHNSLDILPLFNAQRTEWTPFIIAAGDGAVSFIEPDFSSGTLIQVTDSTPAQDATTTNSLPTDVIDTVAIPGNDEVSPGFALVTKDRIRVYRFTQSAPGARPNQFELTDTFERPSTVLSFVDAEYVAPTKLLVSGWPNSILLAVTREESANARIVPLNEDLVGAPYGELEYDPTTGQIAIFHGRQIESWTLEFTEP